MVKKIIYIALFLGVLPKAYSQGAFSYSELNNSPQGLSMGGLSTAVDANAFSVFDNAASVSFSDKSFEAGVLYSPWAKEGTSGMDRDNMLINAGGYYRANDNSSLLFGFSYYAPGGNKMYITDENGNITGDEIRSRYLSVDLGYAYRINDLWSVSATGRYVNWRIVSSDLVEAVSFDVALMRRFGLGNFGNIDASLKLSNWGTMISGENRDSYELPGSVSVGGLWNASFAEKHGVKVGVEAGYRLMDTKALHASGGAEYSYGDFVFVRGGYNFSEYDTKNLSYASAGIGGKYKMVRVDASYLFADSKSPLNNTFMVGLSFGF